MVINISISSLSWIFKQHYRDSSWLKIAWQYCIWTLVLRNTLSHTHSKFQFFSAWSWKWTSVAHRRQTGWLFLTSLLPVTLQIKAQQSKSWKGCNKTWSNAQNSKYVKQGQNQKSFCQGKKKTTCQSQHTNHLSELLELSCILIDFHITETRKWWLHSCYQQLYELPFNMNEGQLSENRFLNSVIRNSDTDSQKKDKRYPSLPTFSIFVVSNQNLCDCSR